MKNMTDSVLDTDRTAVSILDVHYSYAKSSVLNGITLSVPKASIYGLLGSSGCGKTTLLRCVLGRLKPSQGVVTVFGAQSGSKSCGIPGAGVGYMPQEIGLYLDFTIAETLVYFGRLFAMNRWKIDEQIDALTSLLQLPTKSKLIGKLSAGQQRRVSLATALLHSPPLLILDEPTVGVDPLLRQTIWFHLKSLCESGLTIILTTHYIEEAHSANVIAFMRNGRLMAENEPNLLLHSYRMSTLEQLFLKLCYEQNESSNDCVQENRNSLTVSLDKIQNNIIVEPKDQSHENVGENISQQSCGEIAISIVNDSDSNVYFNRGRANSNLLAEAKDCNQTLLAERRVASYRSLFFAHLLALLCKNFVRLSRNWKQQLFHIALPATQMALLLMTIGDNPTDLTIAVFNSEALQKSNHFNHTDHDYDKDLADEDWLTRAERAVTNGKHDEMWSQVFLDCLDDKIFNVRHFDSYDKAYNAVLNGDAVAMIYIGNRFTKGLILRVVYLKMFEDVDEETLKESRLSVRIDRSNQLLGFEIERHLHEAALRFLGKLANMSGVSMEALKLPIELDTPIYGAREDGMREYVLPGCLVLLPFFAMAAVTTHLILEERVRGLVERSLVAGVTALEYLLSHAIIQFAILGLQIVVMLAIAFAALPHPFRGSLPLMIGLSLSEGLCGIMFGLMVSAICSEGAYAAMFTTKAFFVSLIMGGFYWPLENMPTVLRVVSLFLPLTLPTQAMRYVQYRQWTIEFFHVYIGFVSTYIWFGFFAICALFYLRRSF